MQRPPNLGPAAYVPQDLLFNKRVRQNQRSLLLADKPGDFRPIFVLPVIRSESRRCRSVVGRTSGEGLLTSSPSVDRSAQSADRRTRMANRSRTERSVVIVHAT